MSDAWTIAIVVRTVNGDVVLKMTEEQSAELLERLTWLTDEDESP